MQIKDRNFHQSEGGSGAVPANGTARHASQLVPREAGSCVGAGRGASPGSPGCGPRAAAALPCSLNSSLERPPFRPMGGVGLCWLAPRALGEGAFPLRPPVLFGLVCVGFWLLVLPRDLKIQITYQKVDSYNYFVIFASNSINNKNENEILFFFITISPPFVRVVDHCGGNFSFLT